MEKDHNYVLYLSPTNTIEFAIGDGINYRNFETTNSYDTNWHHLAVEFVSSTDMRIYVDGVLQSGTYNPNGKATTPFANSKKTLIGASNTTTEFFKGIIDEVKFYNRVLTEEEIIADYSGSSPSNDPPSNDPPSNDPPSNDPPSNDPPSNDPASDDLSAYWKLDESTSTMVSDSSGNGNAGSVYGPMWTTGQIGPGLLFDGVNDYVDVGNTLNFEEGFTILMWAKRDPGSTWRTLISKGESIVEYDHNYVLYFNPTNGLEFSIGDGTNYRCFKTSNTYDTNWHHLAVEFVSASDMRIYVDGVLQSGTYVPGGTATQPAANSKETLIGASGTTTEFFKGVIDEIKIYNRVLTEEEITLDYSEKNKY